MSEPNQVLSIKDLTRYIKSRLENDPRLGDVWVRGEISNFTRHSSGHMYFTLKDADSRVKAIMFASHNQRLPFMPKDGTKVLARGNISVYERDGQYQMYITQMQPDGIGSLYLAYEQLKRRLETDSSRSKRRSRSPVSRGRLGLSPPLPARRSGISSSPCSAVIRLYRSFYTPYPYKGPKRHRPSCEPSK